MATGAAWSLRKLGRESRTISWAKSRRRAPPRPSSSRRAPGGRKTPIGFSWELAQQRERASSSQRLEGQRNCVVDAECSATIEFFLDCAFRELNAYGLKCLFLPTLRIPWDGRTNLLVQSIRPR